MDETRSIEDLAGEILDNYINGNFSDIRRMLRKLSPLNAAAVVAYISWADLTDWDSGFLQYLGRQWESE